MARLNYAEYKNAPDDLREVYDKFPSKPNIINITKMRGNSPELLKRILPLARYVNQESLLEPRLRELVILTVAKTLNSPYEWAHHVRNSRNETVSQLLIRRSSVF